MPIHRSPSRSSYSVRMLLSLRLPESSVAVLVHLECVAVKPIQPVGGTYPNEPSTVLLETEYPVACKSLLGGQVFEPEVLC